MAYDTDSLIEDWERRKLSDDQFVEELAATGAGYFEALSRLDSLGGDLMPALKTVVDSLESRIERLHQRVAQFENEIIECRDKSQRYCKD